MVRKFAIGILLFFALLALRAFIERVSFHAFGHTLDPATLTVIWVCSALSLWGLWHWKSSKQ